MRRKIIFLILISITLLGLTYLVSYKKSVNLSSGQHIRIGALLPLSGDAAFFGQGELKAIQLAIEETNLNGGIDGKKINLVVEDIGTLDSARAINALNKLIHVDGVQVIIGPTWDMPAVAELANDQGVVLISPDNTEGVELEQNLEYFYSTFYPQRAEIKRLIEFCQENNWHKVVILRDEDIFSQTNTILFERESEGLDTEIIDELVVITEAKDFRTELIKIKQQSPDAILATFASEIPRGPLLQQSKELEINIPVLGTAVVENASLLESYAQYAEGVIFYSFPSKSKSQKIFLQHFEEKYGQPPTGPAAPSAYDAANIIIQAFRQEAQTAEEIKKILDSQTFPSVTFGWLKFNQKGFVAVDSVEMIIKTVKDGAFVDYE